MLTINYRYRLDDPVATWCESWSRTLSTETRWHYGASHDCRSRRDLTLSLLATQRTLCRGDLFDKENLLIAPVKTMKHGIRARVSVAYPCTVRWTVSYRHQREKK
eukprot:scaffold328926_cov35-Attheya_sp.AAC.2